MHGLADLHATTGEWPAHLAALGGARTVIAPAHPGWMGSLGAESLEGPEDYAFHYADLLDALGLSTVDVVAASIGAWFAAELAIRHPGRVGRLVLVCPLGLHVPGADDVPTFFGAVAPRGIGGLSEARAVLFADAEGPVARATLPDDMDRDAQLRWFTGLTGAARVGWAAPHFQSRRLTRHLFRIRCPVLVLGGRSDRLVPASHIKRWVGLLPQAEHALIDATGHAGVLEQPGAVAAAALRFLEG